MYLSTETDGPMIYDIFCSFFLCKKELKTDALRASIDSPTR